MNEVILVKKGRGKKKFYFAPASKSHSFRALLLSLYIKNTKIVNRLKSSDVDNFVDILKKMECRVVEKSENGKSVLWIDSKNKKNLEVYDFKNSGTALRFMTTYLSIHQEEEVIYIDGDAQLRTRHILPLLESLKDLGGNYLCINKKQEIPFQITQSIEAGETHVSGKSSQFLSSLLLNLPFLKSKSKIFIDELNEKPYVDMTLSYLDELGVKYENKNDEEIVIYPISKLPSFTFQVPGDFSSATFLFLINVLSGYQFKIKGLNLRDTQGDKKIIAFLRELGVTYSDTQEGFAYEGGVTCGATFNMNDTPDMFPALAFFLAQYPYSFKLTHLEPIRYKETDRVVCVCENLKNLGIDVLEDVDSISFIGNPDIKKTRINGYDDHRIIMAGSLFGAKEGCEVEIFNTKNRGASYPEYFKDLEELGFSVKMFHEEQF